MYRFPRLYLWGLKIIHKDNFAARYRYMASFVKKNDRVLEPACGPGTLAEYLPKGSLYEGFDTNMSFLAYAKNKKRNVRLGNVLDAKSYKNADVIIACDILHHLPRRDRKRFITLCFSHAKRLFIICEPGGEALGDSFVDNIRKRLAEWIEHDGTNDFKYEYFLTHGELVGEIRSGFGVILNSIKRTTKKMGEDIIAVFQKAS